MKLFTSKLKYSNGLNSYKKLKCRKNDNTTQPTEKAGKTKSVDLWHLTCILLILCLMGSSCGLIYTVPTMDAYLFSEKGDLTFRGSIGLDNEDLTPDQIGAHLGFALSDHFLAALQTSSLIEDMIVGGRLGYYTTFESLQHPNQTTHFEVLLGIDNGLSSLSRSGRGYKREQLFIQPALGISNGRYELQFIFKIGWIYLVDPGSLYYSTERSSFSSIESAVHFAYGWKHFKPFVQIQAFKALGKKEQIEKTIIVQTPLSFGLKASF